jgi:hypothetical protein
MGANLAPGLFAPAAFFLFCECSFFGKPAAPERIRHTPLVAAKYNRQNRTENPLEMGGGGGDEAAFFA